MTALVKVAGSKMSVEIKTHHTESREVLREMLIRLQNETCQRIKDLRRDQEQESESEPADELDSAHTTAEVETHAGLIAREEEKLKYLDEALTHTSTAVSMANASGAAQQFRSSA